MNEYVLRRAALCAAVAFALVVPAVPASAEPAAHVDSVEQVDDRRSDMLVYSPSMDRNIPLQVIKPADTSVPRPTLYLLNGAGGGEDGANWLNQTKILEFLADKNVNVVIPAEGMFTYYTDWIKEDPVVGVAKWETFLTEELPPVIDDALGTTGVNAIAGLSMAATSVLSLAIHAPDLYRGVASYSGCAQTSDPLGQTYLRSVIEGMGETDATNMWGPYDGEGWVAHDPTVNAEGLRGLSLYISNGTGLPGPYENPELPRTPQSPPLLDQVLVGGVIEAATNICTHRLQERLEELDIPATFHFRPDGTHSWGYWEDELQRSWPQLAASMEL
ncbi:esterase family protein [Rhodococcus sp. F64268]|uniref:alpha/beta hydrolase n=1 Tax=Rhodococcus sp. F64268 TaxID=2926402 RepID=UPI001FF66061|nr:alpha/beta hydrolase family protein [Rhodococcus sp. F64268]MCK0090428.1 esterase family protein [Rhodococcus sp. F64268]